MSARTSILRGQNFLRRADVADRLVHLADPDAGHVCVDVGAGNGIITRAGLDAGHRVLAVEIDDRLVTTLRERFTDDPRVQLVHGDLVTARLPDEPFSMTANPPFNQATTILRRWVLDGHFRSAAIIAQHEFARKIAGDFGATKMSAAIAPFRTVDVPEVLSGNLFRPRPGVPVCIMRVGRRNTPEVPWYQRQQYWLLVNFLFERGQLTVDEVVRPLRLGRLSQRLRKQRVRDLTLRDLIELHDAVGADPTTGERLSSFDRKLPEGRRLDFGDHSPETSRPVEPRRRDPRGSAPRSGRAGATAPRGRRAGPPRRRP